MNAIIPPHVAHSPRLDQVQARHHTTVDGVRLFYQVLEAADPQAPTLMLANGLGGKLYAWEPLLERFAGRYRIITWDYRGLFRSERPARDKALSVPHHSSDALELMDAEGVERATFVGWSMGVQVSLETALEHPDRVQRLVLLNGTFGHVFQSGLQPIARLPGVPRLLHHIVERLTRKPTLWATALRAAARSELHLAPVGAVLSLAFRNPKIEDMYRQYNEDVFGDSFPVYMRLFQELDAHSVYHHLPDVTQPTLVISGGLDWLTPSNLSFAIARRIPGAEHLHIRLGSHFAILEATDKVLVRLEGFLAGR
jgi:pimeloyl-ACP methyl ester carboxylesterase